MHDKTKQKNSNKSKSSLSKHDGNTQKIQLSSILTPIKKERNMEDEIKNWCILVFRKTSHHASVLFVYEFWEAMFLSIISTGLKSTLVY